MRAGSANLLSSLGVALPLIMASLPVAAGENDDVMKVVDDFCANPRDKLKDVGVKLSKLGFGAEYGQERGPPPVHAAWVPKLGYGGAILRFSAKSASEPVNECQLVSGVRDLADLVARLKTKFDLGELKASESSVQLTMKGQKTIGGKAYSVELAYGFEENKPSGAFILTVNR